MILGLFQAKWLEALKSGKYTKTKNVLQDKTGYCCLGVACDILGVDKRRVIGDGLFEFFTDSDSSSTTMPQESFISLGLNDCEGKIDFSNISERLLNSLNEIPKPACGSDIISLAGINDSTDDFSFIIRLIEECPEAVFSEPK